MSNVELTEGQEVFYIPDQHHALRPNVKGEYPWVIGIKRTLPGPDGRPMEHIEELQGRRLDQHLTECRRAPDVKYALKSLHLIRPAVKWKGIIKKVNDNGTVDVEHECSNGGVLLYSPGVTVDLEGKTPHSCHPVPAPNEGKVEQQDD